MRIKMNDYIRTWHNPTRRWIYEHRTVMEKKLGRPLKTGEHVHHIDGNPKNNHPDNLELTNTSDHMSKHSPVKQRVWRPVKPVYLSREQIYGSQ